MKYYLAFLEWIRRDPKQKIRLAVRAGFFVLGACGFLYLVFYFVSPAAYQSSSPAENEQVSLDREITIDFTGALSRSIQDYVVMEPATDFSTELGSKDILGRPRRLIIRPQGMQADQTYTLTISSVKNWLGIPSAPLSFTFSTVTSPRVANYSPWDGATGINLTSYLLINFDRPVDVASVGITISPDIPFTKEEVSGNSILIRPGESFREATKYTVRLTGVDTEDPARGYRGRLTFAFTTAYPPQERLTEEELFNQQTLDDVIFNQLLQEYLKDPLPRVLYEIPYTTEDYTIRYNHEDEEFLIFIKTSPEETSKQEALSWLRSKGLDTRSIGYRVFPPSL